MPIDMPLSELKKYQGTNPKPADFEEYWDRAIAEMKAVDPQVTLTKAEFQHPTVDCYDMYFTGVNGARVYAKLLKPKKTEGKCPAVLHFHGYGGASHNWMFYVPWAAAGFVIAAMDVRGQSGKSEDVGGVKGTTQYGHFIKGLDDSPEKLLYRDVFLDTAELAGIVMDMEDVDETRVGAYGGSQGGALTIACASLEPRIKKVSPRCPFLCDYKRVWEMGLATNAYEELRLFLRIVDPCHTREEEIFTRLGYIDLQYLAPRIKGDVLMFTGLMDVVCPPSTQFAAFNKIPGKKENKIYPDFAHEDYPSVEEDTFKFMMELL